MELRKLGIKTSNLIIELNCFPFQTTLTSPLGDVKDKTCDGRMFQRTETTNVRKVMHFNHTRQTRLASKTRFF